MRLYDKDCNQITPLGYAPAVSYRFSFSYKSNKFRSFEVVTGVYIAT